MPTEALPRSIASVLLLGALLLVAVAFATGGAAAQSDQPAWADPMYQNASEMVPTYNDQVSEEDLGLAAGQLKGERINLVVTDNSRGETATVSFRMTEKLEIRELSKGDRDDATLRMTTSRSTVERISDSTSPGVSFRSAVMDEEIEISGLTTVNSVKWTAINTVRSVASLFG